VSAVLRVFWLFYTAFPLQRWLAVVGAVIGGVLIVVDLLSSETSVGIAAGALIFTILTAFPAMFAGAALLRALSAPRSHQLFPYFRLRALSAAALLVASLVLWFGILLAAPALLVDRAVPPAVLVFPFGFVTAVFVWSWLFSGDWRWAFAFVLLPLGVITLVRTGPGAPDAGTLPVIPVLIGASLAWMAFGVWYLRVRLVRPLMLKPASRDVVPWAESPTRNAAIRAVLTWNGHPGVLRPLLVAIGAGGAAGIALLVIAFLSQKSIVAPFISGFIWSFVCMTMAGGLTARVASHSRLLWLTIEGNRDDIRRRVERAAWRGAAAVLITFVVFALVVVFPLGASARELVLGLAVCSSATCYGVYVALAAPQTSKTQILGFGLMALAQIALIARAEPTVTSVAIVVAAQLLGAALFRLLAVKRWRHMDWRLLRPLKGLEGVP
jgi:hypothetical protein